MRFQSCACRGVRPPASPSPDARQSSESEVGTAFSSPVHVSSERPEQGSTDQCPGCFTADLARSTALQKKNGPWRTAWSSRVCRSRALLGLQSSELPSLLITAVSLAADCRRSGKILSARVCIEHMMQMLSVRSRSVFFLQEHEGCTVS